MTCQVMRRAQRARVSSFGHDVPIDSVLVRFCRMVVHARSVVGFEEADKDVLPESRLKTYEDSGRNSRVLIKQV